MLPAFSQGDAQAGSVSRYRTRTIFTDGRCGGDFLVNDHRRVNVQAVVFNHLLHRLADKAVRAFHLLVIAAYVL